MAKEMIYGVDRLKDDEAVVVSDEGELLDVPRSLLPDGTEAGSVLVAPIGEDGKPDWSRARLDEDERARRRKASQEILDQLRGRGRDPPSR